MSAGMPMTAEQEEAVRRAFNAAADARLPQSFTATEVRRDARRVLTAAQLHEAATMAEDGTPLPGTNAHAKLHAAMEAGDFTAALAIRNAIKSYAPEIRAAAIAAENGSRQAQVDATIAAIVDVQSQERARLKRVRKASARTRAQDAQMRHAARGDG